MDPFLRQNFSGRKTATSRYAIAISPMMSPATLDIVQNLSQARAKRPHSAKKAIAIRM
jgi:hypothetical protein